MPKKFFRVYDPDTMDAEDAKVVDHFDHEEAAEKFAEDDDNASAELTKERTLMVQEIGMEGWKVVKVTTVQTVRYYSETV